MLMAECNIYDEVNKLKTFFAGHISHVTEWRTDSAEVTAIHRGEAAALFYVQFKRDAENIMLDFTARDTHGSIIEQGNGIVSYCKFLAKHGALASWIDPDK